MDHVNTHGLYVDKHCCKPPLTNKVGATINIHGVGPSATSFDWATTFGGKSDWQPRQRNWIGSSVSGSLIAIKFWIGNNDNGLLAPQSGNGSSPSR